MGGVGWRTDDLLATGLRIAAVERMRGGAGIAGAEFWLSAKQVFADETCCSAGVRSRTGSAG